jgi:hypothetical protein
VASSEDGISLNQLVMKNPQARRFPNPEIAKKHFA